MPKLRAGHLGEQLCPDRHRLGPGGNYPHCAEPVTLDQLLNR